VVKRSECPTNRESTTADPASLQSCYPMPHTKYDPSTTADLPTPENEDVFTRVPSPLLYHRRSKEASQEPLSLQSSDFTPPSQSIDRYTTTRSELFPRICVSDQQAKLLPIKQNTYPPFIAAKLPLMGDVPSYNVSRTEDVSVNIGTLPSFGDDRTLTTDSCTLPTLTTTNTYIFPKKVYSTYCQPDATWSGPSYTNTHRSWKSTRHLVYPKLSIPDRQLSSNLNPTLSDTGSGN
jgi:hypothetical protein